MTDWITPKIDWKPVDGVADVDFNRIEKNELHLKERIDEAAVIPVNVLRGPSVITTQQASGTNVVIGGRSLVNLLGSEGNFETLTFLANASILSLDYAVGNYVYGTSALRVVSTGSAFATAVRSALQASIDKTKYYVLLADIKVGEAGSIGKVYADGTGMTGMHGSTVSSTTSFSTSYLKIQPSDLTNMTVFNVHGYLAPAGNAVGKFAYFDGMRLFEISASDYAKIGVDPEYVGDKLAAKFPYVDSVQHLRNPAIRKKGKNLLPPLTQWNVVNANAVINEAYKLTLTATAVNQYTNVYVTALPSTVYTLSALNPNGQSVKAMFYSGTTYLSSGFINNIGGTSKGTFTTPANCNRILVELTNSLLGVAVFSDIQLELGNGSQFESQNDDYLYLSTVLASNVDGSIKDTYDSALGTVTRRHRTGIVLDGSLPWSMNVDLAGRKMVKVTAITPANTIIQTSERVTKHDGKILKRDTAAANADEIFLDSAPGTLYVNISDDETGFDDAYTTPTMQEIQAYFNGWQINNGTVGTKYLVGPRKWTQLINSRATFKDKISGSRVENPHIFMRGEGTSLLAPSSGSWVEQSTTEYTNISTLDGVVSTKSTTALNAISQLIFKESLIDFIINEHGVERFGSAYTVAERVAWLKANVSKLVGNVWCTGSNKAGNKATLANYLVDTTTWNVYASNTTSILSKVSAISPAANPGRMIDADGFVYFQVYADAAALIDNPAGPPIVTASGSGSGLAAGTYYVAHSWVNMQGSSANSPVSSVTITAGQNINVTIPVPPAGLGVSNIAVRIGTTNTTMMFQGYADNANGMYVQNKALTVGGTTQPTNTLVVPSTVNADFFDLEVELNVSTLPTSYSSKSFTPYTLDYQLAVSTEETIYPEGSIGLQAGGNQIELLEGLVIREKVTPAYGAVYGNYYINQRNGVDSGILTGSQLKNRLGSFISIYKNGNLDNTWLFNTSAAYGNMRAYIKATDYDVTAEYTVTYLPLDKYKVTSNIIDATVSYRGTLGGAVAKAVQDIADIKTMDGAQNFALDYIEAKADNNAIDLVTLGKSVYTQSTSGTDLNTLLTAGSYFVSSPVNGPDGTTAMYLTVTPVSVEILMQNAYARGTNRVYTRRRENGVWLAWTQVSDETINLLQGTSLNTISTTGHYYSYASAASVAPDTTNVFYIVHIQSTDANYATQDAYNLANNKFYTRRKVAGTWTAWSLINNETVATTAGTNMNTLTINGAYSVSTPTNGPTGVSYGLVEVITDGNVTMQTLYETTTNRVFTRRYSASAWGAWSIVSNETIDLASATDINTLRTSGNYYVSNGVNAPITASAGYVTVVHSVLYATYLKQTYTDWGTGRTWTRMLVNNVWQPWYQLSNETIELASGYNINSLQTNGSYYIPNATNAPGAGGIYYHVINYPPIPANGTMQTAYDAASNRTWTRRLGGAPGVWNAWTQTSNETVVLPDASNANSFTASGRYYIFNAVNAPTTLIGYYYDVIVHSSTHQTQTAYLVDGYRVYTRRQVAGIWTPWSEVYTERKMILNRAIPFAAGGYTHYSYLFNPLYSIGVGNYVYTFVNMPGNYILSRRYDPLTNTFSTLADPPQVSNYSNTGLVAMGTTIYLITTSSNVSNGRVKVYQYNISNNTWTTLADALLPFTVNTSGGSVVPVITGTYIVFTVVRGDVNNIWYGRVHRGTGVVTWIQETNYTSSNPPGAFYADGWYYVIRSSGGTLRVPIDSWTGTGAYFGGDALDSLQTPTPRNYRIVNTGWGAPMLQVFYTTSATGLKPDAECTFPLDLITTASNGSAILVPGLGRVVCMDGSYQDIAAMVNY